MQNKTLIIGISLFCLISCGQHNAKSNSEQATDSVVTAKNSVSDTLSSDTDTLTFDNAKAIEMLKNIYKSYVSVMNEIYLDGIDSVFNKYTTENLRVQLNTEVDEDWSLFPNNINEDALQTMSISLISNDLHNFCVTFYHYDNENNKITDTLKFHLIKDENGYKIDKMLK
jgi:uncharacterized protein YcfL